MVGVVHIIQGGTGAPVLCRIAVAQFEVEQRLSLWGRVRTVVGEVVALRFAMAQCCREEGAVAVLMEANARLGIEEVVLVVNIEVVLLHLTGVLILVELVVVAVGFVAHVAILDVGKHVPAVGDAIKCLDECTGIQLVGIGVVVLIVAVAHQMLAQFFVLDIGEIAEVIAVELLNGESADDVPVLVLIVHVAHQSVGVLCKSLLAHEVSLFQRGTVCERIVIQSEFLQFVVQSELLVVAVAVGVVE